MTDTRPSHSTRPSILQIFSRVVMITNHYLGRRKSQPAELRTRYNYNSNRNRDEPSQSEYSNLGSIACRSTTPNPRYYYFSLSNIHIRVDFQSQKRKLGRMVSRNPHEYTISLSSLPGSYPGIGIFVSVFHYIAEQSTANR